MSLNDTPMANRLHIGIFGKTNSGKSSLINALTNQEIAIVSDIAGTTTDPVYKSMEINGIGPCVFIDTAGFDDTGKLGIMRTDKTKQALKKVDIALVVFSGEDFRMEQEWINEFKTLKTPVIPIINKIDIINNENLINEKIKSEFGLDAILVSAKTKSGIDKIKDAIILNLPKDYGDTSITAHLAGPQDIVMLVMPQDIQAPKGRLILPQVQTIRDLLDNKCIVVGVTTDNFKKAINLLNLPPKLIITDSQVFKFVYENKPKESKITSFSVLFATLKGDIKIFLDGANSIDNLTEDSSVLIAEACTHVPLSEDIGREQIPRLLRNKIGRNLKIDIVSGADFPKDLKSYDLIIHCGSCMFNRKYVLSRVREAVNQGVPISNYGIVIAKLTGILDKIDL